MSRSKSTPAGGHCGFGCATPETGRSRSARIFTSSRLTALLDFDRPATLGMRLDVPSGQSIRFEAGDERDVELVEFGGTGRVIGFNNLLDGATSAQWAVQRAMRRAASLGFCGMQDWQRLSEANVCDATAQQAPAQADDAASKPS